MSNKYSAKNALDDFRPILDLVNSTSEDIIEHTGEQGRVLDIDGTKIVVFLSPIGHNTSANKKYFDARDSGVAKRLVAYNYAKENKYKFFYLGIRPECFSHDYVFSLECPEDILQEITGVSGGRRGIMGNQINFSRSFQPSKNFERLKTNQDIYISCIHKSFLKWYLQIYDNRQLVDYLNGDLVGINSVRTEMDTKFAHNRILFGAPGTGKSYRLSEDMTRTQGIDEDSELYEGLLVGYERNYERVTFHPDYSYANFVGTYKPVPTNEENEVDGITYKFVPGPFMRIYVKALKSVLSNDPEPYLLIIEEINRANVSSVFGDIFQLLDRKADGTSEYSIQVSEDMKDYLIDELGESISEFSEIRLPNNLFIWATMNSADQGVFPMDTAFKRRWDFTYLGIDDNEEGIREKKVVLGEGRYSREVEWNVLRKLINSKLESFRINEDKLLGPYFISEDTMNDPDKFKRTFKNKVIMYLFEDAAKHKRSDLFSVSNPNIYSKICHEFDEKGVAIFGSEIADRFQVPNTQNVQSEDLEAVNDLDETDEE